MDAAEIIFVVLVFRNADTDDADVSDAENFFFYEIELFQFLFSFSYGDTKRFSHFLLRVLCENLMNFVFDNLK